MEKIKCSICEKEFNQTSNYYAHNKSEHNIIFEIKCECGREFEKSQSLNAHYRHCLIHRKGLAPIPPGTKGKPSKFRGMKIDEFVSDPEQMREKISIANTGNRFNQSEDAKRKISEARIKYLESSTNIKWFDLNGIKVQGKWEYNVGLKLLELGYSISRFKIKYDGHRTYTPDFSIADGIFVEVKGWLSDRDIVKYQKVFKDHPDIKVYLIRDEKKIGNYSKFISGQILLDDCEDLRVVCEN